MCALSEMINLFSQSFRPAPPPQIQVDTQQTEGGGGQLTPSDVNSLLPLRSFFAASSNRPGRWITTPLPGAGKNKSTKTGGGQGVTCRGVRTLKRKGILFTRSNQPERASVAPSGPNVSLHHRRRTNPHATCVPIS